MAELHSKKVPAKSAFGDNLGPDVDGVLRPGYGSFDIVVEEVIATVSYGPSGKITATEDAFVKIAAYADEHANLDKTLRFSFPYVDTIMRIAITLDKPL